MIEKIQSNKEILKSHKIKKNLLESDLLNSKYISLITFKALCILSNINIIAIKDNNTYSIFFLKNSLTRKEYYQSY